MLHQLSSQSNCEQVIVWVMTHRRWNWAGHYVSWCRRTGNPIIPSNHKLDLFELVPGSTTRLRSCIANWSAFCHWGSLIGWIYWSDTVFGVFEMISVQLLETSLASLYCTYTTNMGFTFLLFRFIFVFFISLLIVVINYSLGKNIHSVWQSKPALLASLDFLKSLCQASFHFFHYY